MKGTAEFKRTENRAADFLWSLLIAMLYCISIAWAIYSITDLYKTCSMWQLFMCCALLVLLCHVVTWNKKSLLITFTLIVVLALAAYIAVRNSDYWASVFAGIWMECTQMFIGIYRRTFDLKYALPALWGICFLCALYGTVFIRKAFGFIALVIPGVIIFIIELLFKKLNAPLSFYMFLVSIAMLAVLRPGRGRDGRHSAFAKYIPAALPVCIAAVTLGAVIASSFDTTPNITASALAGAELNSLEEVTEWVFGTVPAFDFSRTGFSPYSKQLGGDITPDRSEIMTVKLESGELRTGRLYLAGATKDMYDGHMWTSTDQSYKEYDAEADTAYETAGSVQFASQVTIKVEFKKSMNTFFLPLYVTDWDVGERKVTQNGLDDKRLIPGVKAGESYTFSYMDLGGEEIKDIINMSSYTDENYIMVDGSDFVESGVNVVIAKPEEFTVYRGWVYETFTDVSDTVPERVHSLALDITAEQETAYEKMKALESYLQSLSYTFSPGNTPTDRDFVDYFLFDKQEGYCTYFATAMCIMARILGYPARYVEGYVASNVGAAATVVTNAQAHAWPEIYIDGAGWVRFEPTPAYAQTVSDESTAITIAPEMEGNAAFQEHLEEAGINKEDVHTKPAEGMIDSGIKEEVAKPEIHDEETDVEQKEGMGVLQIAALVFVLIALILILTLRLQAKRKQRYLQKLKNSSSDADLAVGYARQMAILLMPDGISRLNYETMAQFAERIQPQFETLPILEMARILEKAVYGQESLTMEEKNLLVRGYYSMDRHMRKKLGVFKYTLFCVLCFRRQP